MYKSRCAHTHQIVKSQLKLYLLLGDNMSYESKILAFRNLYDEISRRMPVVEGRTFTNEYINADFSRYSRCSFHNCTIVFEFGMCSFNYCDFSACKFEAKTGSPAQLVLMLDKQLRDSAFKERNR